MSRPDVKKENKLVTASARPKQRQQPSKSLERVIKIIHFKTVYSRGFGPFYIESKLLYTFCPRSLSYSKWVKTSWTYFKMGQEILDIQYVIGLTFALFNIWVSLINNLKSNCLKLWFWMSSKKNCIKCICVIFVPIISIEFNAKIQTNNSILKQDIFLFKIFKKF